jgi:hypothetical protein
MVNIQDFRSILALFVLVTLIIIVLVIAFIVVVHWFWRSRFERENYESKISHLAAEILGIVQGGDQKRGTMWQVTKYDRFEAEAAEYFEKDALTITVERYREVKITHTFSQKRFARELARYLRDRYSISPTITSVGKL